MQLYIISQILMSVIAYNPLVTCLHQNIEYCQEVMNRTGVHKVDLPLMQHCDCTTPGRNLEYSMCFFDLSSLRQGHMNFLMWCMLPPLIFSILLAFVKPFFSQSFFVRLKFAIKQRSSWETGRFSSSLVLMSFSQSKSSYVFAFSTALALCLL